MCCNVPLCWIFWNHVSSPGSHEICRNQGWELNCLVSITSNVHALLFLLQIWCQYFYASTSGSCVHAFCNWSLKMPVKCQWVVSWNWGRVLLIQIGICASYVQGIVYLLLWACRCFSNSQFNILMITVRSHAMAARHLQGITMLVCFMMKNM